MDFENCPEKKILENKIYNIEKIQNMRDEEQEQIINNLQNNMADFMVETKQEMTEIKQEINNLREDMPKIIEKELKKILDDFMLNSFKRILKWFSLIFISALSFIHRTQIIHFLKNIFK